MGKSLLTTCYRIWKTLNPGLPGQATGDHVLLTTGAPVKFYWGRRATTLHAIQNGTPRPAQALLRRWNQYGKILH
jgi:hypothetical protein